MISIEDKLIEKTFRSQTSSLKPLMDIKPYRLRFWEEFGGTVSSAKDFEGACIAVISNSKSILLPKAFTDLLYEGQRAMILRTDVDYRLRTIKSANSDVESLVIVKEG